LKTIGCIGENEFVSFFGVMIKLLPVIKLPVIDGEVLKIKI
jgi:hypothetical protein